jgi:uncharacterized Ntn-hydrolase superfamily protein
MKKLLLIIFIILFVKDAISQDTFSIVAIDSITGEVGSAGASCVDMFTTGIPTNDFLGQLIPNVGAINTQAYYIPANQTNATNRMNMGDTPSQIIDWLVANDVQSTPEFRQYGIIAMVNGSPQAAAYTGTSTDNYKNHIIGDNYAIQGNILLGQEVLDSMEARFMNESGDLTCKLMAALQGANMTGADTRCSGNGTSSLFAFIKVAQPTDIFGSSSFNISVRTHSNSNIEPIDSLQIIFDLSYSCSSLNISENHSFGGLLKVTDLLGRDTKGTKNEPLFYIYNDGTVEKRIVVE